MNNTFDHISINDDFWIQLKSHLISYGFKGLPESVHYTISFNSQSPTINFHVTKNVADPTKKPQLKIIEIEKDFLAEIAPSLLILLFRALLQPLDLNELKNEYGCDLGFISFDSLTHTDYQSVTERVLIDNFKDIIKPRRKTRLKIAGNINQRLENFANSDEMQREIRDKIVELPEEFTKQIEGGIILTEKTTIQVIRINEKWYKLKTDLKPPGLLEIFVEPTLAKRITWKTKRALVLVKNAKTFSDLEHLNTPIRLIKQKKDPN